MPLREYQLRIADDCVKHNTIVLLPTGSGKTLIAAEAIRQLRAPTLFLVPTISLVEQQSTAIRGFLSASMLHVGQYYGGMPIPQGFDILVATPKAFESALQRGEESFKWDRFGIVVFDEVHHVLKDHPYRALATKIQNFPHLRVIGLSASLTYSVGKSEIEKSIKNLCHELNITHIKHATDEELKAGGYLGAGRGVVAEVRRPDLKERADVVPIEQRKPHLMHKTFFDRIARGSSTPFSRSIVDYVRGLETEVRLVDSTFKSPLECCSLKTWGEFAHGRIEISILYRELEHFYEGLRLLVVSWEEAEDTTTVFLQMTRESDRPAPFLVDRHFERFQNLCSVLCEKLQESQTTFRGILFVQQRVTTHVLQYNISRDERMRGLFRSRCLYSVNSKATASLGVSKKDASEALRAFSSGEANLLITTSVAEEGIDIPEANIVIYFDPIHQAVSYVQGRGRARQEHSSFVVLNERQDRPAALLAEQELEQHAVSSSYKPSPNSQSDTAAAMKSQADRERSAATVLMQEITDASSIAVLNLYCKKTKVDCDETIAKVGSQSMCTLTYKSVLRDVRAEASAGHHKSAKQQAAVELLMKLRG